MTWTSSPSIIPSTPTPTPPIPNPVPVRRSSSTPIPTTNGLLDPDIKLTRAQWRQLWKNAETGKIHVSDEQFVEDINVQFLYKPHTLTAFAVIVMIIIYAAFTNDSDAGNTVSNTRLGISICAIFILILGLLVFPSGPFIRPHPVFWRLSFGIGVLYEMFLIILLFQTKHDARQSLTFLYPYLGRPLEEREYAADCTLTWSAFHGNLFDIYFVGHFIGWFCKSLLLRNRLMCWTISVQWELIEMAFTHMLPNFAECWWDSWLLDVLISNGLGIFCGHKVAQYLEMKQYTWNNVHTIPTLTGKLQRVAMQFTPESWTKVRWESTKSIKRFLSIQLLMLAFHVEELNAFFLKHILWIPPPCPLNHFRLAIWMFVGTPCIRQLYTYIVDPAVVRIGNHTLLGMVILSTELLNIVKFGQGEFPNPIPPNIQIGVGIYFTLYALFCLLMMISIHTREGPAGPSWEDAPADAPETDVKHVTGNGNGTTAGNPITKKQQ